MMTPDSFDVKFTSREVSAWGGLALLKRMLDGMDFKSAMQSWGLPKPGSNRGYAPGQLIEQIMPIRLTPKDTIGGSFTRRQTLPVVAAPSFWALTG